MRSTLVHRTLIVMLMAALLPAGGATPANALTCPTPSSQDVVWNGAGDGTQLTDGANWVGGVVPTSTQTACIPDPFATESLEKSGSSTFAVMALQSSASIMVTGGTLHLLDDSHVEGEVLVNG
ncbi:MAG TPA: hypothetical protein VMM13_03960, partial [Euzebya sp.]|nr:hypothetical protein [Euzebya sp.]